MTVQKELTRLVAARKADGRSDLAQQLAATKMATAAVRALDDSEQEGTFYDLIYSSIHAALSRDADVPEKTGCS